MDENEKLIALYTKVWSRKRDIQQTPTKGMPFPRCNIYLDNGFCIELCPVFTYADKTYNTRICIHCDWSTHCKYISGTDIFHMMPRRPIRENSVTSNKHRTIYNNNKRRGR